jgi:membrane fusion protein, copper/silver efflux system
VQADIYEFDLPFVRIGQTAEMTLAYYPGTLWKGEVTEILPSSEEKTRTITVRLEFANDSKLLMPGMYTDIVLKHNLGRVLAVPESAVIFTGEREIVFIAKGNGIFEPCEITTGVKARNFFEIKKGLTAGDKVAVGPNFLLDSESKFRATLLGK